MGFINYHGEKEDHFDEVVEYSKAQQDQERRDKEEEKLCQWLIEAGEDSSLGKLFIQDYLKLIILNYKALKKSYDSLVRNGIVVDNIDTSRLWKDFSLDLIDRHIRSFHINQDDRIKHLQVFISKVFKLEDVLSANEHYEKLSDNKTYEKYFMEAFDITWTGQHFYYLLRYIGKDNYRDFESFFDGYSKLLIAMNLYFNQAFKPRDNAWQRLYKEEKALVLEIRNKPIVDEQIIVNLQYLRNPLYFERCVVIDNEENLEETVESAGLNRSVFDKLIEQGNLDGYIQAAKLIFDCELPEEISINYGILLERMPVLKETINKFKDIYQADMGQFEEYFAPETLRVTATLIEYQAARPSEEVLAGIVDNVRRATKKLILAVNEKIDEIYKYVTIETNAEARALEALMSQDGYVDSEYRIR